MISSTLHRLTAHLPLRIISSDGAPYLERYGLFRAFGLRAYIHRFVGDDPDRGLHDHPWPWAVSIKLHGRYFEERRGHPPPKLAATTKTGIVTRVAPLVSGLTGNTFHRVVLRRHPDTGAPLPVWTLFIHRDKFVKPWGFWHPVFSDASSAASVWRPHDYGRESGTNVGMTDWESNLPKGKATPGRAKA